MCGDVSNLKIYDFGDSPYEVKEGSDLNITWKVNVKDSEIITVTANISSQNNETAESISYVGTTGVQKSMSKFCKEIQLGNKWIYFHEINNLLDESKLVLKIGVLGSTESQIMISINSSATIHVTYLPHVNCYPALFNFFTNEIQYMCTIESKPAAFAHFEFGNMLVGTQTSNRSKILTNGIIRQSFIGQATLASWNQRYIIVYFVVRMQGKSNGEEIHEKRIPIFYAFRRTHSYKQEYLFLSLLVVQLSLVSIGLIVFGVILRRAFGSKKRRRNTFERARRTFISSRDIVSSAIQQTGIDQILPRRNTLTLCVDRSVDNLLSTTYEELTIDSPQTPNSIQKP